MSEAPVHPTNPDSARAAWRAARTFGELCELGARFVEGTLPHFPGWMAQDVDEETEALVPVLARLNRAGFLTCASQPGAGPHVGHDGRVWRRRAFVAGFALPALEQRLATSLARVDLAFRAFDAEEGGAPGWVVGLRGRDPYLFAGGAAGPDELALFAEALSAPAFAELVRARYASAIDLAWEERDVLWRRLDAAI